MALNQYAQASKTPLQQEQNNKSLPMIYSGQNNAAGDINLTKDELILAVREAVREEFHALGLRADDHDHIDEARKDFSFLRGIRKSFENVSSKIGNAILLAISGVVILIFSIGFKAWMK
jgi:hypothetical protein